MKLQERIGLATHIGKLTKDIEDAYYVYVKSNTDFDEFILNDAGDILGVFSDSVGDDYKDVAFSIELDELEDDICQALFVPYDRSIHLVISTSYNKYIKLKQLTAEISKNKSKSPLFYSKLLHLYISEICSIFIHELEHAYQDTKAVDKITAGGKSIPQSNKSIIYHDKTNTKTKDDIDAEHQLEYLSNEHEIDAYSVQEISKFIASVHNLPKPEQIRKATEYIKNLPKLINRYADKKHIVLVGDALITLRKKYMKKISAGVAEYIRSLN